MILNSTIWQEVITAAKTAAAKAPEWLRAVERARYWSFADGVLMLQSTTSGELYRVDEHHVCPASRHGKPCKHRASRRLMQRYFERLAQTSAPAPAPAPKSTDWRDKAILIKRDDNALIVDGWAV